MVIKGLLWEVTGPPLDLASLVGFLTLLIVVATVAYGARRLQRR